MDISEYIRRTPITDLMSGMKPVDLTPPLIPPRTGPSTPTDVERKFSLNIDRKELPDFSDPEIQRVHDDITRKFSEMHEKAMIKAIIGDNFYGTDAVCEPFRRKIPIKPVYPPIYNIDAVA